MKATWTCERSRKLTFATVNVHIIRCTDDSTYSNAPLLHEDKMSIKWNGWCKAHELYGIIADPKKYMYSLNFEYLNSDDFLYRL